MKRTTLTILFSLSLAACVSKYDFNIEDNTNAYIVEANISDKSFTETLTYPSDGRYFTVKLSKSSAVDNVRDEKVSDATIQLIADNGETWPYTLTSEGLYSLINPDFKAELNRKYQLQITTSKNEIIQSSFEELPNNNASPVGELTLSETQISKYKYTNIGRIIETVTGINVAINLENQDQRFFKWKFEPFWVYTSPAASTNSSTRTCYISSDYYFPDQVLLKNNIKNAKQELFFLQTKENELLDTHFSNLIVQEEVSENYYQYWLDLQAQEEKGGLYDNPPFNLNSNLTVLTNQASVQGYFGVSNENATRWVFNRDSLSYPIPIDLQSYNCLVLLELADLSGKCTNCLEFPFGNPKNIAPNWYKDYIDPNKL